MSPLPHIAVDSVCHRCCVGGRHGQHGGQSACNGGLVRDVGVDIYRPGCQLIRPRLSIGINTLANLLDPI